MTFTKLFSSITESTIWLENDHTRIIWITMLAMTDRYGRVWASVPGLANRARVPVAAARTALETLMAPDPDSRTKDHQGRRIQEIDGGWQLLNHEKYRVIRDTESALESKRKYINARRAKERGVENVDRCRDNAESDADAYSESDADSEKIQKGVSANATHCREVDAAAPEKDEEKEPPSIKTSEEKKKTGGQKEKNIETVTQAAIEEAKEKGFGGRKFTNELTEWVRYRMQLKKPVDWGEMFRKQIEWMATIQESDAIESMKASQRNGWTGLFPPKEKPMSFEQQKAEDIRKNGVRLRIN